MNLELLDHELNWIVLGWIESFYELVSVTNESCTRDTYTYLLGDAH